MIHFPCCSAAPNEPVSLEKMAYVPGIPFRHMCEKGSWSEVLLRLEDTAAESSSSSLTSSSVSSSSSSSTSSRTTTRGNGAPASNGRWLCDREGDLEMTPLNTAIHYRAPPEVIEALAKASTEALSIPDKNGCLPLHHLASQYHEIRTLQGVRTDQIGVGVDVEAVMEDLFKTAVLMCPGSIKVQNSQGRTPLHSLLANGGSCIPSVRVVELLIYGSRSDRSHDAVVAKETSGGSGSGSGSGSAPAESREGDAPVDKENEGNVRSTPGRTRRASRRFRGKMGDTSSLSSSLSSSTSSSSSASSSSSSLSTVAAIADHKQNFPLHLVCTSTLLLRFVDIVLSANPKAVFLRNTSGKLPVQILASTLSASLTDTDIGRVHVRRILRAMVSKWNQATAARQHQQQRCDCVRSVSSDDSEMRGQLADIAARFGIGDSVIVEGLGAYAAGCSCRLRRQVLSPIMERGSRCDDVASAAAAGAAKCRPKQCGTEEKKGEDEDLIASNGTTGMENGTMSKGDGLTTTMTTTTTTTTTCFGDCTTGSVDSHDIEAFAWYENGTFPLCEGKPVADERGVESTEETRACNFGLRYALREQNCLMEDMAKTNQDLQDLLVQQISFGAEKEDFVQRLRDKLDDERDYNRALNEELRYLKVQVVDAESGALLRMDEEGYFSSDADGTESLEESTMRQKEQNYDLRREILRQNELMAQMAETNNGLHVALAEAMQHNEATEEELRLLRVRVADIESAEVENAEEEDLVIIARREQLAAGSSGSGSSSAVAEAAKNEPVTSNLERVMKEQSGQLAQQQDTIRQLQRKLKEREESDEAKACEYMRARQQFKSEDVKCKKVIKAQERIINDLKRGLKEYKECVSKHAAAASQDVLLDKMVAMNETLDATLERQLSLIKAKNEMLLELEHSLVEERSVLVNRSVLTSCDSTISSAGLEQERAAKVVALEAKLKEKDEKIETLNLMMKRERIGNEEMLYAKKYENMMLRRELQESIRNFSNIIESMKAEGQARERRAMGTTLAFVLSLLVHLVFIMEQLRGKKVRC